MGQHGQGLVTPALFIMSVDTFEIEILYELDISIIQGASTISIESLNFVDENNFQMVVRGYLSDELEKTDGKKKNTDLANRPHLIEFKAIVKILNHKNYLTQAKVIHL